MKSIVFTADPAVMNELDEYMYVELRKLMKVENPQAKVNNVVPYEKWIATTEGRLHMQLMVRYVLQASNLDSRAVNKIQRSLQAQGRETKGRPRQYDARLHDFTINRKLRLFLLNKLVAKGLGVNTDEWIPPIEVQDVTVPSEPRDVFDSLLRFEAWSNFKLPRAAWLLFTRTERLALSAEHVTRAREADGGISFEIYRAMCVAGASEPLSIAA